MLLQRLRCLPVPAATRGISGKAAPTNAMSNLLDMVAEAGEQQEAGDTSMQQPTSRTGFAWRPIETGIVMKPWDLSAKGRAWRQTSWTRKRPIVAPPTALCKRSDPFYQLNIDPRSYTTNPMLLSEYASEMGKIHNRTQTGLTSKTQRRLGQAIRRAKHMGIIPFLHQHHKL